MIRNQTILNDLKKHLKNASKDGTLFLRIKISKGQIDSYKLIFESLDCLTQIPATLDYISGIPEKFVDTFHVAFTRKYGAKFLGPNSTSKKINSGIPESKLSTRDSKRI
jgi:hypothetical protein